MKDGGKMKKYNIPDELEPCCELCEYACKVELTGEMVCKYKFSLKKIQETDLCKNFSFNIFAYKPKKAKTPKVFDFTKI